MIHRDSRGRPTPVAVTKQLFTTAIFASTLFPLSAKVRRNFPRFVKVSCNDVIHRLLEHHRVRFKKIPLGDDPAPNKVLLSCGLVVIFSLYPSSQGWKVGMNITPIVRHDLVFDHLPIVITIIRIVCTLPGVSNFHQDNTFVRNLILHILHCLFLDFVSCPVSALSLSKCFPNSLKGGLLFEQDLH